MLHRVGPPCAVTSSLRCWTWRQCPSCTRGRVQGHPFCAIQCSRRQDHRKRSIAHTPPVRLFIFSVILERTNPTNGEPAAASRSGSSPHPVVPRLRAGCSHLHRSQRFYKCMNHNISNLYFSVQGLLIAFSHLGRVWLSSQILSALNTCLSSA